MAARKLSVGFVQKEPPLLVYEMCIGVLNTLNLYRKPCVRQRTWRSFSYRTRSWPSSSVS